MIIINQQSFKLNNISIFLDVLRGIAALAIVVFHFMKCVYTDARENFIGHGFLAVVFSAFRGL